MWKKSKLPPTIAKLYCSLSNDKPVKNKKRKENLRYYSNTYLKYTCTPIHFINEGGVY